MPSTQINSTGVTFPDATSQTTARTASNTVTSFNGSFGAISYTPVTSFAGQTGAVDPTTLGNIGNVLQVYVNSTSFSLPNTTIAGSSLYYPTTLVSYTNSGEIYTNGSGVFGTRVTNNGGMALVVATRTTNGNTGFQAPLGFTTLSGTWRILSVNPARIVAYDSCAGRTDTTLFGAYAVRIS